MTEDATLRLEVYPLFGAKTFPQEVTEDNAYFEILEFIFRVSFSLFLFEFKSNNHH